MQANDAHTPPDEPEVEEVLELLDAIEPVDEEVRTSTGAYLNEIGLIPLLTAEEEWALAERVQVKLRGDRVLSGVLHVGPSCSLLASLLSARSLASQALTCNRTRTSAWQAYDNHMNLIMSDVVETVTIVDVDEHSGAESLRVRPPSFPSACTGWAGSHAAT